MVSLWQKAFWNHSKIKLIEYIRKQWIIMLHIPSHVYRSEGYAVLHHLVTESQLLLLHFSLRVSVIVCLFCSAALTLLVWKRQLWNSARVHPQPHPNGNATLRLSEHFFGRFPFCSDLWGFCTVILETLTVMINSVTQVQTHAEDWGLRT